ncbi:anaerobic sulfatase maturase [Tichowtungia aerotolerans]|uniref:Anaerobic sulfatase maturase n=1 Tax=Tichowtungia aerotolerans TaxID=2697043 RepID=A0A6P1M808_9BACT|nr:anaerobic sulfatase maturase [Tichowtungia aerotolerans]QHI70011.1 anaerobic sulfatase maturase [Tichowtungia aerotolerans]
MLNQRRPFHLMAKPAGPDCNLNCTYCFYLEKEAIFQKENLHRMSDEVLEEYVKQYCESQNTPEILFAWQGGEPTLMGVEFFEKAVAFQKKYSAGRPVQNAFQTNGTLIDNKWCKFLAKEKFLIGLSLDGPRHVHDKFRVDRGGKPTFDRVMKALKLMKAHRVDFNTLTCVTRQNAKHAVEIYNFLKSTGSTFLQFIPIIERKPDDEAARMGLKLALPPDLVADDNDDRVMPWTVQPEQYGQFLIDIFEEWVRRDVGTVFVQIFDVMLNAWMGMPPPLCVFAEKCGDAMIIEHNGDLYSCDHFVYPEYYLGNMMDTPMTELISQEKQLKFGSDKLDKLPKQCLNCDVRFACNGECPKHRFMQTADGEPGLSWLCAGYKMFMHHIDPYMQTMARLLREQRPAAEIMGMIPPKAG